MKIDKLFKIYNYKDLNSTDQEDFYNSNKTKLIRVSNKTILKKKTFVWRTLTTIKKMMKKVMKMDKLFLSIA
jgi:hypothetical protein